MDGGTGATYVDSCTGAILVDSCTGAILVDGGTGTTYVDGYTERNVRGWSRYPRSASTGRSLAAFQAGYAPLTSATLTPKTIPPAR